MITRKKVYDVTRTEGNVTRRQIDPYEQLANAVIMQAVADYRMLRSGRIPTVTEEYQLNMKPEVVIKTVWAQKEKLIKFFKSTWFGELTKISSVYMLEKLDSEECRHWKPARRYVVVDHQRLKDEIERRDLGIGMLYRLTKVKGDYFISIVRSKKVIIPLGRAEKIADGLGIPRKEFIIRKIMRGE